MNKMNKTDYIIAVTVSILTIGVLLLMVFKDVLFR